MKGRRDRIGRERACTLLGGLQNEYQTNMGTVLTSKAMLDIVDARHILTCH